MNVGPVEQHQSPNIFQKIVCDIGKKKFEGTNPGFTYSIFSRCTTIGTPEDKLSSSLYFFGKNFNEKRISNLSKTKNGNTYNKVLHRNIWIHYLQQHTHSSNLTSKEKENIFHWATHTQYTNNQLIQIITKLTK